MNNNLKGLFILFTFKGVFKGGGGWAGGIQGRVIKFLANQKGRLTIILRQHRGVGRIT